MVLVSLNKPNIYPTTSIYEPNVHNKHRWAKKRMYFLSPMCTLGDHQGKYIHLRMLSATGST